MTFVKWNASAFINANTYTHTPAQVNDPNTAVLSNRIRGFSHLTNEYSWPKYVPGPLRLRQKATREIQRAW